jgi:hypothetical protein
MGTKKISQPVLCGSLSSPSLGPVGLDLSNFVCILECVLVILLGGVGSRSIRVENVICWLDFDSLCEFFTLK